MKLIAISGKAESGKDWLTRRVLLPEGFFQVSFADHFKIATIGKGAATHEEVYSTKPKHVRDFLQDEGTKRGRELYGENVWVNTAFAWMRLFEERNGIDKFVIADVRFKNEADAIRKAGGLLIRIDAPNRSAASKLTEEQRRHKSETDLDDYPFDYRVDNNHDGDAAENALLEILCGKGIIGRFRRPLPTHVTA